jgi:hypothetical protein
MCYVYKRRKTATLGVQVMMSATDELILHKALALLQEPETKATAAARQASIKEIQAALAANAALRATVSVARGQRVGTGRGGRPSTFYAIVAEPGGVRICAGMRQTAELLAQDLKELDPLQPGPSMSSLAVTLSRSGQWWTVVETDSGNISVTVRKATPAEIERITPDTELTED